MNIKLIAAIAGGFVAGAAAGFLVAWEIRGRQKEKEVQEAWDTSRAYIASKEQAMKNKEEKQKRQGEEFANTIKNMAETVKEMDEAAKGLDIKKLRTDSEKAVRSYRRNVFSDRPTRKEVESLDAENEDEVNELLNDIEDEDYPQEDTTLREDPYVIDVNEWVENQYGHEQITLYLYNDGTCINDERELIDDLDRKIGKENLDEIDRLWDSGGSCLIRNEMEGEDYELLRMDEDYDPAEG